MVEKADGGWTAVEARFVESTPRGPVVHQDTMNPTVHPCDGKLYESKSAFRSVTRAHGCYEIGNESAETLTRAARQETDTSAKHDLIETYNRLRERGR